MKFSVRIIWSNKLNAFQKSFLFIFWSICNGNKVYKNRDIPTTWFQLRAFSIYNWSFNPAMVRFMTKVFQLRAFSIYNWSISNITKEQVAPYLFQLRAFSIYNWSFNHSFVEHGYIMFQLRAFSIYNWSPEIVTSLKCKTQFQLRAFSIYNWSLFKTACSPKCASFS